MLSVFDVYDYLTLDVLFSRLKDNKKGTPSGRLPAGFAMSPALHQIFVHL